MGATVKCNTSSVEEVKVFLEKRLNEAMSKVDASKGPDKATFSVKGDLISVDYFHGEVWGRHYDYVDSVDGIFEALKNKFPDVAISGEVIAEEGMVNCSIGTHFECSSNEYRLHSIGAHEAQTCLICGKSHKNDVFLNSDGFTGEGELESICSPTCMLEFLSKEDIYELVNRFWSLDGIMFNDNDTNISREQIDSHLEDEDYKSVYNDYKSIFLANIDNYIYDFAKNEERIHGILSKCKSTEWKAIILQITENIRNFKEKWSFLDDSKLPEYPFADGQNRGFVDIPLKSKTLNRFIGKNGIPMTMMENILKHTRTEIINRLVPLENVKCGADAILLILKMYYLLCTDREDLIIDSINNLQVNDIGTEEELAHNIDIRNLSLIFNYVVTNRRKISRDLGNCEINYYSNDFCDGEFLLIKNSTKLYFKNQQLVGLVLEDKKKYNSFQSFMESYHRSGYEYSYYELDENESASVSLNRKRVNTYDSREPYEVFMNKDEKYRYSTIISEFNSLKGIRRDEFIEKFLITFKQCECVTK